jgi:hypothetical protein
MSGFKPYKPRQPGTIYKVIETAFDQAGGLDVVADLIDETRDWCYSAADPNRERRQAASLTYSHVRTMTRAGLGVVAFAEELATLAGGVFMPLNIAITDPELQGALAKYSLESGQAIAEIINRAADGKFDAPDATAALPEIDDALRALMVVRAFAVRVAGSG